jgi:maleylpyruvate isomerase
MAIAPDVAERIEYVRDATRRLLADLDGLADVEVARPSLCVGWTAGHVLTHLARSGDALRRSVEGARRGETVAPYVSMAARTEGIEAGATRTAAELTADVAQSSQALDDAWASLDAAAWDREMPHHRLGKRPITDTVTLRWTEVEVHGVDLAGAYSPADWPAPFVAHVLVTSADTIASRLPPGTALDLTAIDLTATDTTADTPAHWFFGQSGDKKVAVTGPSWAVAAWLLGRSAPVIGELSSSATDLPLLAPWG